MGVAAGLATMGYVPCFQLCHVCRRPAFEQIRNSIAYPA